jgi:hypothetical protein
MARMRNPAKSEVDCAPPRSMGLSSEGHAASRAGDDIAIVEELRPRPAAPRRAGAGSSRRARGCSSRRHRQWSAACGRGVHQVEHVLRRRAAGRLVLAHLLGELAHGLALDRSRAEFARPTRAWPQRNGAPVLLIWLKVFRGRQYQYRSFCRGWPRRTNRCE